MVSQYLRTNILGLVAIFIALGGTAVALPGKNQVNSGDIKNANVKNADIADGAVTTPKLGDNAVTGAKTDEATLGQVPSAAQADTANNAGTLDGLDSTDLQNRVTGACAGGDTISSVAADGTVTCETDEAGGPPSGSAGGDLAGSYPDPQIAGDAVNGAKVQNNSLDTDDILDASLFNDNSLGGADIDEANLDNTVLQRRVGTSCVAGSSIRAIDNVGGVTCETDDSGGPPTGAAGGDLTGTYPNPTLGNNSVSGGTGGEITDNSITGADVNESTLAGVVPGSFVSGSIPGGAVLTTPTSGFLTFPASVVLAAGERVYVSSNAALGTTSPGGADNLRLFICTQSTAPAGPITTQGGGSFGLRAAQNTRQTYGLTAVVAPGAGTFNVGLCGDSTTPANWNSNEFGYTSALILR